MRRFPAIALACAALACAAAAPGAQASAVRELGYPTGFPFPPADCPGDGCQVVAQLTGFQVQLGKSHNPFRVGRPGWIVAFTVRLSKPSAEQLGFFKTTYGDTPEARLGIVKSLKHERRYKLLRQTDVFELEKYFGSTPTFVLQPPLRIHKDEIVALTVPTWLPAFAHNLTTDQAWRSSRSGSACTATNPPPAAQQHTGTNAVYGCFYRTARLLYSATFVPDPTPSNPPPKGTKSTRSR